MMNNGCCCYCTSNAMIRVAEDDNCGPAPQNAKLAKTDDMMH